MSHLSEPIVSRRSGRSGIEKAPRLVSQGAHLAVIDPDSYFILRLHATTLRVLCQIAPGRVQNRRPSPVGAGYPCTRRVPALFGNGNHLGRGIPCTNPCRTGRGGPVLGRHGLAQRAYNHRSGSFGRATTPQASSGCACQYGVAWRSFTLSALHDPAATFSGRPGSHQNGGPPVAL